MAECFSNNSNKQTNKIERKKKRSQWLRVTAFHVRAHIQSHATVVVRWEGRPPQKNGTENGAEACWELQGVNLGNKQVSLPKLQRGGLQTEQSG